MTAAPAPSSCELCPEPAAYTVAVRMPASATSALGHKRYAGAACAAHLAAVVDRAGAAVYWQAGPRVMSIRMAAAIAAGRAEVAR